MAADDLATQGARASATMVFTIYVEPHLFGHHTLRVKEEVFVIDKILR